MMRNVECWYHVKSGIWLGAMPKCGTRSIVFCMVNAITGQEYDEIKPSKLSRNVFRAIPGDGKRIAVIRNPIDRFRSLWRCQARDGLAGIAPQGARGDITPRRLIEMCRRQDNRHYAMQKILLDYADEVIKFETLPSWWERNVGGAFPHHNATKSLPSDDPLFTREVISAVELFYAEDMKIYANAT